MSKEEIVNTWKKAEASADDARAVPANPAGEVNLSDNDLEAVAGGADDGGDGTWMEGCTSAPSFCKGTCALATEGCCTSGGTIT
jgi:mersacidin/lichenicidin family type 2 lantibiotic